MSQKELAAARSLIREGAGVRSIRSEFNKKLPRQWQARRVVNTEKSRIASMDWSAMARRQGIKKFRVAPSAEACPICKKAAGGHRADSPKPPYHPNCKCQIEQ